MRRQLPTEPPASLTTSEPLTSLLSSDMRDDIRDDTDPTVLSCGTQSWVGLRGPVVVLRVVGEIDLFTIPTLLTVLNAAVFGAVDEPTSCLVVDVAGVTFCNVQGFALMAEMAVVAAANQTGYALSGCNPHLERCWRILDAIHPDAGHSPITRYVSTASAVIAAHTEPAGRSL